MEIQYPLSVAFTLSDGSAMGDIVALLADMILARASLTPCEGGSMES